MSTEPVKSESFDNGSIELWTHPKGDTVQYPNQEIPTIINKVLAYAGAEAESGDPVDYYATLYPAFLRATKDKEMAAELSEAKEFIAFIVNKFSRQHRAAINLFEEGLIDPSLAHHLLIPGQLYEYRSEGGPALGIFKNVRFLSSMFSPPKPFATFISSSYQRGTPKNRGRKMVKGIGISFGTAGISVDPFDSSDDVELPQSIRVTSDGYWAEMSVLVRLPDTTLPVDDFPIKLADKTTVSKFAARGRTYYDMVSSRSMAAFTGHIYYPARRGPEPHAHHGRVVVDGPTMHRLMPDMVNALAPVTNENNVATPWNHTIVPPEACIYTMVPVFSLQHRKWGAVDLDKLLPITFRSDAIDKLVIPKHNKDLLRALVKNHTFQFEDLVDDKNSATIALLSGPPGTGKSLTAQAVAESLRRPLYSVSLNNIDDDDIESQMTEIFELALVWNAVVLVDEADALMRNREKCDANEARRVATFLRVVEAHPGILFLTSNHPDSIDEAMRSRVAIAIKYRPANYQLRRVIWKNLSSNMAGAKINTARLALWPLNGREIKHALKVTGMISQEANRAVTTAQVENVLRNNYGSVWPMIVRRFFSRLFQRIFK